MSRSKVEFRIAYGSVGALEAERFALALIHWDGGRLRAARRHLVPSSFGAAREPLERTLRALERAVDRASARPSFGLDDAFPVREGDATGISWSPLRVGHTSDPERHFRELADSLLLRKARTAADEARRRASDDRFLAWIEQLGDPGGTVFAAGRPHVPVSESNTAAPQPRRARAGKPE